MVLSQSFQEIIHSAIYLAVNELNHQYLTCEHILFCIIDYPDIKKMLDYFSVDLIRLRNKIYQFLQYDLHDLTIKNFNISQTIKLKFTDHLVNFFERLILNMRNLKSQKNLVEPKDFLIEVLLDQECYAAYFLKKVHLNVNNVTNYFNEQEYKNTENNQKKNNNTSSSNLEQNSSTSNNTNLSKKDRISSFFDLDFNQQNLSRNHNFNSSDNPDNSFGINSSKSSYMENNYDFFNNQNAFFNNNESDKIAFNKEKNKNSILENYCINFNARALSGKLDPIFDRDLELKMLLNALYCRRKGNALLVGDSGVGKTAIIEFLAQKIVNKNSDIPHKFKNALIYSLELNSLISGTRYRGDLEERLKILMNEIENSKQLIILFIDEIHTVIGTGSTNNGTLDIGNILKPYLARGVIYCIGATTRKEFTQFLSKDKAFLRRFQLIYVNEPSESSAKKMLKGIIPKYAKYHNVEYTENSIEAAIKLSKRYIKEKQLPDVALDIIDYAGSAACIQHEMNSIANNKKLEFNNPLINDLIKGQKSQTKLQKKCRIITKRDIEEVICQLTKIPRKQISAFDAKNILSLKENLQQKIIGQDEAIGAICKSIIVSKSGLNDDSTKPIASYIFYGPTGVGKTELSIQLADYMGMNFIRVDMSEYSEAHSVAKLFGAPPGYVGYEQSGILTEKVLKNPYSVVLFDEIEKAHISLQHSLLQILDYGNLTDNFGQQVNFNHTIIICTTNTGAQMMEKITLGFDSVGNNEITMRELEQNFSPEFRNRFSAIIKFNHLDKDAVNKIIQKELNKIITSLKKKNIELCFDKKINDYIIHKGYNSLMGARVIERFINDEIKIKLAELFLQNQIQKQSIKKVNFIYSDDEKIAIDVLS